MKRCWIHIGMHKTGSSSIQSNLGRVSNCPTWKILKVGGVPNMGKALHAMFASQPHKFHKFTKLGQSSEQVRELGKRLRDKMVSTIRAFEGGTVIISAESLIVMDTEGIRRFREFLLPFFDEVRVIGYVRPPAGYKNSFFQQRLKDFNGADFDLDKINLKYRSKFERFDDIFGRENVVLRKFEPSSFPNKCIVSDFCGIVGIEGPGRDSIQRVNESLTREACGIIYCYRKFGPDYGVGKYVIRENSLIVAPMLAMGGTKFQLSAGVLAASVEKERDDVKWMEVRLGDSLAETLMDEGGEVAKEEDLLRVGRAACEEFVLRFEEMYGIAIPGNMVPRTDPADPQAVADMVAEARKLVSSFSRDGKAFLANRKVWVGMNATPSSSSPGRPVKRCILHIGMPKTGSSSIQRNLANLESRSNWSFLSIGGSSNMGPALIAMFSSSIHHSHRKRGLSSEEMARKGAAWRAALADAIQKSEKNLIIISAELLVFRSESEIKAIREFIKPLCDEVLVIGYVRPPISFKASLFQQNIKSGKARNFDDVGAGVDYRRMFSKFDRVFGRENVKLRKFDPALFPGNCIVRDFCNQLGIKDCLNDLSIRRVNESLSREACAILYAYRMNGSGYGVGRDVIRENLGIINVLLAIGGEKLKFSSKLLAPSAESEIKSLKWMEKRLGQSLAEFQEDKGGEISSEQDLLRIPASACRQYAEKFREIYGSKIPSSVLPASDPVSPQAAANMVEYSRQVIRQRIDKERRVRRFTRLVPSFIRRWWKASRKKPVVAPATS